MSKLALCIFAALLFVSCKEVDKVGYWRGHYKNGGELYFLEPLNEVERDDVRIKTLQENGYYYFNPDVKKCYWVVLIYQGVAFDAVDCRTVSHLLVNKSEYQKFQLKLEKEE